MFSLKGHYLGGAHQSRRCEADKHNMDNSLFYGDKRSFTFENYTKSLYGCFTDLQAAQEDPDRVATTEEEKVKILLNGCNTSYLHPAKAVVLSTNNLKHDFDAACDFLTEFQAPPSKRNRTISSVVKEDVVVEPAEAVAVVVAVAVKDVVVAVAVAEAFLEQSVRLRTDTTPMRSGNNSAT